MGERLGFLGWVREVWDFQEGKHGGTRTSRTRTAAPSLMMKPSRALSKGREACCGLPLKLVLKDRERSNPVKARG